MPLAGTIFDLDGTLVDSQLDFDAIRRDMGLSAGQLILEGLEQMPEGDAKDECRRVLEHHEREGAARAVPIPGVEELLAELDDLQIVRAILTRNSRVSAETTLAKLGWEFSIVLTREDVPPKPDPAGLVRICAEWDLAVDEVLFFGDFAFDLQAGRNAGMRTVLYAPGDPPDYADLADYTIEHFRDAIPLVRQLAGTTRRPESE